MPLFMCASDRIKVCKVVLIAMTFLVYNKAFIYVCAVNAYKGARLSMNVLVVYFRDA